MRRVVVFGIFFTFAILFSANVFAAPAPTLFIYNDAKKECGTFRDGDEYVSYTMPQGWQTYGYEKSQSKTTQAYCDELGYKNIGSIVSYYKLKPKTLMTQPANFPFNVRHFNYTSLVVLIIIAGALTVLALYIKKRRAKHQL